MRAAPAVSGRLGAAFPVFNEEVGVRGSRTPPPLPLMLERRQRLAWSIILGNRQSPGSPQVGRSAPSGSDDSRGARYQTTSSWQYPLSKTWAFLLLGTQVP